MARVLRTGVAIAVSLAVLVAGCNVSARAFNWQAPSDATVVAALAVTGRLDAAALNESSGLTPSLIRPGLFWTHNDSGSEPMVFAIDTAGQLRHMVRVAGAENRDWEAIGSGACPTGVCLYIADVGDNMALRKVVTIWRVREPVPGQDTVVVDARLDFRYEDGARDVEAMVVAPDTSLLLITKRPRHRWLPTRSPVQVYHLPASAWRAGGTVTARRVGTLPIVPGQMSVRDWVTDAALSPVFDGRRRRLAVLTYGVVHVFEADVETGRPGARLGQCALGFSERDAEAVAWLPDGRLLITNEGQGSRVHVGRCP
jgi:hypothetical protein